MMEMSSAVVSIMTKLDDKSMIFINFDVYKVHQIGLASAYNVFRFLKFESIWSKNPARGTRRKIRVWETPHTL